MSEAFGHSIFVSYQHQMRGIAHSLETSEVLNPENMTLRKLFILHMKDCLFSIIPRGGVSNAAGLRRENEL